MVKKNKIKENKNFSSMKLGDIERNTLIKNINFYLFKIFNIMINSFHKPIIPFSQSIF